MAAVAIPPSTALADPPHPPARETPAPIYLKQGVVVVASKDASVDDTWQLASAVYRIPLLRPRRIDEPIVRALAGEPPPRTASARVHDLFELRATLAPDGGSTRRLLGSIAGELAVSGVVLTYREAGAARARLFVADRATFDTHVLWPRPGTGGATSWDASVRWLSSLATSPAKRESERTSVFASPWFWGALVAGAGVVIIGYAATRDDEPEPIHLQGRVSP